MGVIYRRTFIWWHDGGQNIFLPSHPFLPIGGLTHPTASLALVLATKEKVFRCDRCTLRYKRTSSTISSPWRLAWTPPGRWIAGGKVECDSIQPLRVIQVR